MIKYALTTGPDPQRPCPGPAVDREHEVIAALGLAADAPAVAEHPQAARLVGCTTRRRRGAGGHQGADARVQRFLRIRAAGHFVRTAARDGVPPDRYPPSHAVAGRRAGHRMPRSDQRGPGAACAAILRPNSAASTIRGIASSGPKHNRALPRFGRAFWLLNRRDAAGIRVQCRLRRRAAAHLVERGRPAHAVASTRRPTFALAHPRDNGHGQVQWFQSRNGNCDRRAGGNPERRRPGANAFRRPFTIAPSRHHRSRVFNRTMWK